MGEVYRADDLKLGQAVALKVLPDELMHDPARLAQFHDEVRVARTISHRNVCRTYDIGDADGRPFLTMEYVDGEDLSSLLRHIGRFPQEKAIEVARQISAPWRRTGRRGASPTRAAQLALELAISLTGIVLVLTVLLQFGLLSLVITVYTFLSLEGFPLTLNLSRPYAASALLPSGAIAGLLVFGFYASRGDEPLFGQPLLDD